MLAGGDIIDIMHTPLYLSKVKNISLQLLRVIVHMAYIKQICGNIGDYFPNTYTNEKINHLSVNIRNAFKNSFTNKNVFARISVP